MDLFTPVVPPDQLHPNFVTTIQPTAVGVRAVLSDWASGFIDRDRKFVREFQTTYNSCFWELYLFAVLKHLKIDADLSHTSPDFVSPTSRLAIEATIASHAIDDVPEWEKTLEGVAHDNLNAAYKQGIIRLSNAFTAKSRAYIDGYAALPHMQGISYVIAISNFGTQDFFMLGDVAMQRLLYDTWQEAEVKKKNGASVQVGLFNSPQFSHVSAVLYSSVATFGKARALGNDDGNFVFQAVRIRDNFEPIMIAVPKRDYQESLTDGLRLFLNPYAATPIDLNLFNDMGIRRFVPDKEGDVMVSCHPDGDLCVRQVISIVESGTA